MTAKQLTTLMAVASAAIGGGCVHHPHSALALSMTACHDQELACVAPVRQRVYLFIMNGANPLETVNLCHLRNQVFLAGYPKVYVAQQMDEKWYEREVRRVAEDDPQSRVVLLGVGTAADKMIKLAAGCVEDGVAIDTLILLDPACEHTFPECLPNRVVALFSHAVDGKPVPHGAEVRLAERSWYQSLPKSRDVVETVVAAMTDSAHKVGPLDSDPPPSMLLSEQPDLTPRGLILEASGPPDEWDFLKSAQKGGMPAKPVQPPLLQQPNSLASEALPTPRKQ